MRKLDDYIQEIECVIPNDFCDEVVGVYQNEEIWKRAETFAGLRLDVRDVHTIEISNDDVINDSLVRARIDKELFGYFQAGIRSYLQIFPYFEVNADEGYKLLRYEVGQFYKTHYDQSNTRNRHVSCIFALNDEYEGGEIEFVDIGHKKRIKKGSILFFPSNFMYRHQILPVTKGTRYSIVTWLI